LHQSSDWLEDRPRSHLYYVKWDIEPYYSMPSVTLF